MVLDLMTQLDREFTERNKIETLLRELLDARRSRKSEQLSADQQALFAAEWQAEAEKPAAPDGSDDDDAATPWRRRVGSAEKDGRTAASSRTNAAYSTQIMPTAPPASSALRSTFDRVESEIDACCQQDRLTA
jgi:hypothetical protein